ncbi:hypothetical protein SAMN04487928_1057 [Butyrivibrio proteoclasticus]|uniref:Uncharacterized protein n=1 Tax=Butyrivibrio proteoclasticus TaxID=43305 RepID=A0A1I5RWY9_9FIRM|nr:hypothetical protein [Butyrivibrio proteoclasticus]SFP62993.1 hypothetical protein SAMN04487928_1057 [Butyrivibrio proteoclasticus]
MREKNLSVKCTMTNGSYQRGIIAMNKEWSEQNKRMQSLIKKADTFNDLKIKVMNERREELKALSVVSSDENAVWLIDYWCNKDLRGLIQMPFSRHWIMHTEACLRIKNKLK